MRMLLKVTIPTEAGNRLARDGKLGTTLQAILAELKPEAAYFTETNGKRTGFLVVQLEQASDIPALAEPLFLSLQADVEIRPCMLPEDLAKAAPAIERAARQFGAGA